MRRFLLLVISITITQSSAFAIYTEKNIDSLIKKHLGKNFRRATIHDIYGKPKRKQKNYFDFARRQLQKISQGDLLKFYRMNFDQDGLYDYAIIVNNERKHKNSLLIANDKSVLLVDEFKGGTYLEPLNYGKYPTTIPTKEGKREINGPAIKLVSFDEQTLILYLNKQKKKWEKVSLAF